MDLLFEICETEKEWELLVFNLEKKPSSYEKEIIMNIQNKYLHNEEKYLEMRLKNLEYGSNYKNLIDYYEDKNNKKEALEIAEKGIENGKGRLTELLIYQHFRHFSNMQ